MCVPRLPPPALEHGLAAEEPDMIYKAFVDLRVGTADEREKLLQNQIDKITSVSSF